MQDLNIKVFVVIPRVPNFISTDRGSIDVADFSDDDLRKIAADWTNALVEHAHKRRAQTAEVRARAQAKG